MGFMHSTVDLLESHLPCRDTFLLYQVVALLLIVSVKGIVYSVCSYLIVLRSALQVERLNECKVMGK